MPASSQTSCAFSARTTSCPCHPATCETPLGFRSRYFPGIDPQGACATLGFVVVRLRRTGLVRTEAEHSEKRRAVEQLGNAVGVLHHSPGSPQAHPGYAAPVNSPKPHRGFTSRRDDSPSETMPQSLVQFYAHLVFSTKRRRPFLRDDDCRERLHAYMAGVCEGQHSPALSIGGTEDHVHVLCRLSKTLDVSTLIRELKRESTKWLKKEFPRLQAFSWQEGYGAFSLSPAHVKAVQKYIADQVEHHRRETSQEEFRRVCTIRRENRRRFMCGIDAYGRGL